MRPRTRSIVATLALCGLTFVPACSSSTAPAPAGSAPAATAAEATASTTGTSSPAASARAGGGAFLEAQRCALCHSHSPRARAMTNAAGDDVSPHATWSATTMANSFRDPYWRAQMAREVEAEPERGPQIEALCLRCHAPAASHQARLDGRSPPTLAAAAADPLAHDGVTCTVCHQAQPASLGTPESFSGRLDIRDDKLIFGPYAGPSTNPMRMHTGYTPTHGKHVSSSALCGSCHTLYTHASAGAPAFLEQAPYLEWRNSIFSDEGGRTESSRSCVECHMVDQGSMRIARMPPGRDFNIAVRDNVRAHAFVGGNAFMLDLFRENAAELGITASAAALERTAAATRALLGHDTARLEILEPRRDGARLVFRVRVENLAGHKLPSGYPSRRAWLDVEVRAGSSTLFESGAFDTQGQLVGVADELALPHVQVVSSPAQVAVYEMIAHDAQGRPTTSLAAMVKRVKDTRLLPLGWRADGPHADETAPVGTQGDADFAAGSDTVTYDIELPADAPAGLTLIARLFYQPIPPAWADGLRASETEESRDFLRMYDAADKAPESLATTVLVLDPGP